MDFHPQVRQRFVDESRERTAQALSQDDAGTNIFVDRTTGDVDRIRHKLARHGAAHRTGDGDAGLFLRLGS